MGYCNKSMIRGWSWSVAEYANKVQSNAPPKSKSCSLKMKQTSVPNQQLKKSSERDLMMRSLDVAWHSLPWALSWIWFNLRKAQRRQNLGSKQKQGWVWLVTKPNQNKKEWESEKPDQSIGGQNSKEKRRVILWRWWSNYRRRNSY